MQTIDPQRALHLSRLSEALREISGIRERALKPDHPDFEAWRDRIRQSLGMLFGEKHDYRYRFSALSFHEPRAIVIGAGTEPGQRGQTGIKTVGTEI